MSITPRSNKASFFDVDGVIYTGNIGIDFMRHLYAKGILKAQIFNKVLQIDQAYQRAKLKPKQYYERCAKLWTQGVLGLEKMKIENEGKFLAPSLMKQVSSYAREAIEMDRRKGHMIIGISASPAEIVRPLCNLLEFDDAFGTEIIVKDGKFTGELVKPWPIGQGKVEYVKKVSRKFKLNLAESKAYGNSKLDLPMLKAVGTPITVNPDDKLVKIAKKYSWEIEYW